MNLQKNIDKILDAGRKNERLKAERSRLDWIDLIKGVGAMLVILAHEPIQNKWYSLILCFIMIPIFFFASGYVTKFDYANTGEFLYKRVFKLLVIYCVYGLLMPFTSVSEIKKHIQNPISIVETIKESVVSIIYGKVLWFIACLIVSMLIFTSLQIVSKNNMKCLLVLSTVVAVIGIMIARKGIFYWSADTALICQCFFTLGYILKRWGCINIRRRLKLKCLILSLLYLIWIGVWAYLKGTEEIIINVATNQWKIIYITIPAIILGNSALICFALIINNISLINFVGRHSLVYFAFGSHGMSIAYKFFSSLALMTNSTILSNDYIICPLVCVLGSLIMVIPCLCIDRFIPVLNGQFCMPELKKG